MKDCKWNPPTNGSKGQLFRADGTAVSREDLNAAATGTVMLKFFDETADRATRRRARQLLDTWSRTGDLKKMAAGSIPLPDGWTLHVRDTVADKTSGAVQTAEILGLTLSHETTSLNSPAADKAFAAVIAAHRRVKMGAPNSKGGHDELLTRLMESQGSKAGDVETFVRRFDKASTALSLEGVFHEPTAPAIIALRAKWMLDELDLRDPKERKLVDLFAPTRRDLVDMRLSLGDASDVDADVLASVGPVFGGWRPLADLLVARHEKQLRYRRDEFGNPVATPYAAYFSEFKAAAELCKQHPGLEGTSLMNYFDVPESAVTFALGYLNDDLAPARSFLLALNLMNRENNPESRLQLPDDLPIDPIKRLRELTKRLEEGHRSGKVAGSHPEYAARYLSSPELARPYVAITRAASPEGHVPAGALGAATLGLSALDKPSTVLAAMRDLPADHRQNWDLVQLSSNPRADELVCMSALAAARTAKGQLPDHVVAVADRVAQRATLAELADAVVSDIHESGRLSEELKARITASGLAHRLAADTEHPTSFAGVKAFSDACQGLFQDGSFDMDPENGPASYRAAVRLSRDIKDGGNILDREELRQRLDDERSVFPADGVLVEEAVLARMRAAAGGKLGITAAAYLLSSNGHLEDARLAVAVAPNADVEDVAAAVRRALPQLASFVRVRSGEVLVDAGLQDDHLKLLERLDVVFA